jgi:hypothetical protein
MDISALLFVGLMILIGIIIFSIFPILTFLLYRHLRKKGKVQKHIGLVLFILTTLGMIIIGLKAILGPSGFGPDYETVDIDQKIGGKLLCNSVYTADLQSWYYNIDYKYIDLKGDTIDFKSGSYYNRDWKKDEQILKYDKFLILKTGSSYFSDRLIIKNTLTDSIKTFDIYDQFIEQDSLWKTQNIKSLLNYCCAESFIESIKGNEILIKYKFRTDEKQTRKYGEKMIYYQLDGETGNIKMTKIE